MDTEKPLRISMPSLLLLCAALAGCSNAGQPFTVTCGGTGADCYAKAAEICPADYDIHNTTLNPYERTMMGRCK